MHRERELGILHTVLRLREVELARDRIVEGTAAVTHENHRKTINEYNLGGHARGDGAEELGCKADTGEHGNVIGRQSSHTSERTAASRALWGNNRPCAEGGPYAIPEFQLA